MNDRLDTVFAALADPTRRAIVARLAAGEARVSELAAPFDISAPAISRHLKVLERAGLISRRIDAQSRVISLNPETLRLASSWVDQYRRFWEGSLDRLEAMFADGTGTGRNPSTTEKRDVQQD